MQIFVKKCSLRLRLLCFSLVFIGLVSCSSTSPVTTNASGTYTGSMTLRSAVTDDPRTATATATFYIEKQSATYVGYLRVDEATPLQNVPTTCSAVEQPNNRLFCTATDIINSQRIEMTGRLQGQNYSGTLEVAVTDTNEGVLVKGSFDFKKQ